MTIRNATLTVAALLLVVAVMFLSGFVQRTHWCPGIGTQLDDDDFDRPELPPFTTESGGCYDSPWWAVPY